MARGHFGTLAAVVAAFVAVLFIGGGGKAYGQPRPEERRTHSDRTLFVWWADREAALDVQREPTLLMEGLGARVTWVDPQVAGLSIVQVPPGVADVAVELLAHERGVVGTTVDYSMRLAIAPNDPNWATDTPIQFNQYTAWKACLEQGWEYQRTSSVVCAVLDTGGEYAVSEIYKNIRQNPGEVFDNIDNDGNGIIDDVFGAEFLSPDDPFITSPPDKPHSDPLDVWFHGTFVGSILSAKGNNDELMSGIVWDGSIIYVKVVGGFDWGPEVLVSNLMQGVSYAYSEGARVVNMSLADTYYAPFTAAVYEPLRQKMAACSDALFVVAAGNAGYDLDNTSGAGNDFDPAEFDLPNMIVVGASNASDGPAAFSNFGSVSVDVFAPGVDIVGIDFAQPNLIITGSGTSAATPIVAGLALLRWQQVSTLTPVQLKQWIMDQGDAIAPALTNKCVGQGNGACTRVNPAKVLGATSCP